MKRLMTTLAVTTAPLMAEAQTERPRVAPEAVYSVAPPLGTYTDNVLFGEVWVDEALSPRDRSIVTVSALISSGRSAQVGGHTRRALDNGVTPEEIAEIVAHLAFYSGWPNAISAVPEIERVFTERGITVTIDDTAAPLAPKASAEIARAVAVAQNVAPFAPGLAADTDAVLFADLWLRPGLAPRDRSLSTMAALIAMGQAEQLGFHLNRAMDAGLTRDEAGEVLRHAAYYTGWPRAMSAVPAMKAVFDAREAPAAPVIVEAPLGLIRGDDAPRRAGPEATFAGTVVVGPLFSAPEPGRLGGGLVSFEAGAHTAWHTHPLGQTLYVTEGCILAQSEGEETVVARPGDIVQIPANVRHWHGASLEEAGSHVAMAEALDGVAVTWMEHVTDAHYAQANGSCAALD